MEYQMPKNPTRIEINCATGVESIIELTDAEVAEMEAAAAIAEADAKPKTRKMPPMQWPRRHCLSVLASQKMKQNSYSSEIL
jgi:hypothetical protein